MTNEGKAIEIMADFPNDHTQLSQEMFDVFLERISQMAEWKDEQTKIAIEKAKAEAQLEILNWMKDEVATYYTKEQVMRKIRYLKKKLEKLNEQ